MVVLGPDEVLGPGGSASGRWTARCSPGPIRQSASPRPATSSHDRSGPGQVDNRDYAVAKFAGISCASSPPKRSRSRPRPGREAVRRRLGHPRGRGDPREPFRRPARDRVPARSSPFSRPTARRDRRLLHALRERCDRWGACLVLDKIICCSGAWDSGRTPALLHAPGPGRIRQGRDVGLLAPGHARLRRRPNPARWSSSRGGCSQIYRVYHGFVPAGFKQLLVDHGA